MNMRLLLAVSALALVGAGTIVVAQDGAPASAGEVNVYSGRHYPSDQAIYDAFTAETGIKVNILEGKTDEILQRIEMEGAGSPADVFITADAGNLWRAQSKGLLQAVESEVLAARIPETLREPGNHWFGLTTRVRVIMVAKRATDLDFVDSYADLADARLKGRLCMRSGSNIYNLSLTGALIARWGEEKAGEWAAGIVANLAQTPTGGDTDQLKAVAAGICDVTISNTYYLARLAGSENADDKAVAEAVRIVYPDQDGEGAHVNISGAGVAAHAPNRDAAVRLIEYLASDAAQSAFANGNNEYPVVPGNLANPVLEGFGTFKADPLPVAAFGANQALAQAIMDRAGWK
ncbi:MAG TPA: Fe(3+) ABC transporter substrate-binding protein [Micropepsaceae bacterium]|nr:Fe(3+) ABC transporter substrate-binding protein [Micropepsaceae bacterium]